MLLFNNVFLIGVFEENARLLQWLVFFRQFNAIGPLLCSFVQHQLELRTSKTYSKRQNLVQNKNIDVRFGVFRSDLFRHYATFFNFFVLHQRVSPSFVSIFCNTRMSKNSKGPPFTFFGPVTLFNNHFLRFFQNFCLQKVPLSIFFIFCNKLEFHKARRVPPFTILSLRYSADFARSRLVCC